jgi:hypothetical protein
MRILSWNVHISANPVPHWSIQVKTGNGENHLAELTGEGFKFGGHNKPAGAAVLRNGGASNRTWGELSAFLQDYKKRNGQYNLFTNNCFQLTDAVEAFLK